MYLSNQNSQNVRNVRIAVSSTHSFGGLIKIEIYVIDKDEVKAKKGSRTAIMNPFFIIFILVPLTDT